MTKIIFDITEGIVTRLAPASFYKILDGEKVEPLGCGNFSFAYQGGDYVYTITDNIDAWKDICYLLRLPHLPTVERLLTDDNVNLYRMPKYRVIKMKGSWDNSNLPYGVSDKTIDLIKAFIDSSGSSVRGFVAKNRHLLVDFPTIAETLYQIEQLTNDVVFDYKSGNLALDADNNLILLDMFIVYREWLADEVQEKLKW